MTLRLLILHSDVAGYTAACLNRLQYLSDVQILLVRYAGSVDAPFELMLDELISTVIFDVEQWGAIVERAIEFNPTVVLLSGWHNNRYNALAMKLKNKNCLVVCTLDNQWRGDLKQYLASVAAPYALRRFVDIMWGAGERQAWFAKRLGFAGDRYWRGMYSCDTDIFKKTMLNNVLSEKKFIFIGRLVEYKGILDLLAAYAQYRTLVNNPWQLVVLGTGHLLPKLSGEGVDVKGFAQPVELARFLNESNGVLVLPSHVEPWGVVIHEATSMGLPVLCSDACGAGVHLVQSYFNGMIFEQKNIPSLLHTLLYMHNMDDGVFCSWQKNSLALSKIFSIDIWCETLLQGAYHFTHH